MPNRPAPNPHLKKRLSCKILEPPKRLTVDEWAAEQRRLSPENSSEPGIYRTSRTPYIIGPSQAFTDPTVKQITIMKSAQTGFTTMIENIIGYIASMDPCSILCLLPTVELAEDFSRNRIALMARDTPCLSEILGDNKAKTSSQTILYKHFTGGNITFAGSNSASSLASKSVRVLLVDEADRCSVNCGLEGNAISLAMARTKAFWNRKHVLVSTPTVHKLSRIEAEWLKSDQNRYYVPCPACNHFQVLKWGSRGGPFGMQWENDDPETAYYQCENCPYHIQDSDKARMNLMGEWRAHAPFTGNRGYHINEIYSPFVTFAEMAKQYLETSKLPDKLKTFVNLSLGEPWEEQDTPEIETDTLSVRAENYTPTTLPDEIVVVTAGADVQGDRIEVEAIGWGRDFESWGIEKKILYGQTNMPDVWKELDTFLQSQFETIGGRKLKINAACIDSGYQTDMVYQFVKPRFNRRVFATKGYAGAGKALVARPTTNNTAGVRLFSIGVDTAKEIIVSYLKIEKPGPGYCHYPNRPGYDEEFYQQLTSEKQVTVYVKGYPVQKWQKVRARNESLDIRVYARAALDIYAPNLNALADKVDRTLQIPSEPDQSPPEKQGSAFMDKVAQSYLSRNKRGGGSGFSGGGWLNK